MTKNSKKHAKLNLFVGFCAALICVIALPISAATEDQYNQPPLAREEPHHHVVFQNSMVRVFRVLIPPGGSTSWHEHNFDFGVLGSVDKG